MLSRQRPGNEIQDMKDPVCGWAACPSCQDLFETLAPQVSETVASGTLPCDGLHLRLVFLQQGLADVIFRGHKVARRFSLKGIVWFRICVPAGQVRELRAGQSVGGPLGLVATAASLIESVVQPTNSSTPEDHPNSTSTRGRLNIL